MVNYSKELASPFTEYTSSKTFDNFQILHDKIFTKIDMNQEVGEDLGTTGKHSF
jgi:hypothetical protein